VNHVALDRVRVSIAFDCPCVNDLAARLAHWFERFGRPFNIEAELLDELALRSCERLLSRLDLALWDGPGAMVLSRPESAAGMNKEDLQRSAAATVEQDSGALFGHGSLADHTRVLIVARSQGNKRLDSQSGNGRSPSSCPILAVHPQRPTQILDRLALIISNFQVLLLVPGNAAAPQQHPVPARAYVSCSMRSFT
jgi:hypothetical protein